MNRLLLIFLILFLSLSFETFGNMPSEFTLQSCDVADSIVAKKTDTDSIVSKNKGNENWWIERIKAGSYNIGDSTIIYPSFAGFCVKVYHWADRTFNSYNHDYVSGTGKRWKLRLINDNWVDTYAMNLYGDMPLHMRNDMYYNIGASLQYMAVSIGYSININNLLNDRKSGRKRFDFGFNCAKFDISLYCVKNTDGTYIHKFGNQAQNIKRLFPGLNLNSFGVDGIYFFNNMKYSHGAAYNFSKFQLKSCGSFIVGISYFNQDITMDFSILDADLLQTIDTDSRNLKFHYANYCLIGGYGYNWVFNKHFLFNITAIPSAGLAKCYDNSTESNSTLLSLNAKLRVSMTYNYRNLFAGIQGRMDGNWYDSSNFSLYNSIFTLSTSFGIRF